MEFNPPGQPHHSPSYYFLLRAGPHLNPLRQVHAHIIISGLQHTRSLLTKLLTFACQTSSNFYVHQVFRFVQNPDSFLFNSLINSTSKNPGFSIHSLYFYRSMLLHGISPSSYTFTSVVKSCSNLSCSVFCKLMQAHAFLNGFGLDMHVQTSLVASYSKCGHLRIARRVFDKIPERDIVCWNSMVSGYEQNGFAKEAIDLFQEMKEMGSEIDSPTIVSVLSACAQLGALGLGSLMHGFVIENGLDLNVMLGSSLINMYARCGNVRKARKVFDSLQEKNLIVWTSMMSGYGMNGSGAQAVDLFYEMLRNGSSPNAVTFVAVLSACAHAGLDKEGHFIYSSMRRKYHLEPGVEHHVCYVDLLGRAGYVNEAYNFIKNKLPNEADPSIWTALLGACKMHKNFNLGVQVAHHLLTMEPENHGHYISLISLYVLIGKMDQVKSVRGKMFRQCLKNHVGYSTMDMTLVDMSLS